MAYLDDLIEQVPDPGLAARLAAEVEKLRKRLEFGLLFERHVPEVVRLHGHQIRVGQLVQFRRPDDGRLMRVTAIEQGKVDLEDPWSGEVADSAAGAELVAIRPFGEPIYPGLERVGGVHRAEDDRGSHVVVCGENFDVLQMLSYVHEGQVDCIYIDPPYNTGARDWKYNNDYVDSNDDYRHSKWLSMMERRLRLAEGLLKEDGVVVVTIDEHEVSRLGVLLSQVFPTAVIQMVSIVINPSGASSDGLSRVDEYAFFCFFGSARPDPLSRDLLTDQDLNDGSTSVTWESLLRRGNAWYRRARRNLCYPVLLNGSADRIVGVGLPFSGDDESARPAVVDGHLAAWPVRTDGRLGIWRVEGAKLFDLAQKGFAYVGGRDDARGTWTIRYLMEGTVSAIEAGAYKVVGRGARGEVVLEGTVTRTTIPKTVWKSSRHIAGGSGGTQMLTNLLGERNRFTYPKSVYAVEDTLAVATGSRPDALILDFFGGSGTTVHATALLNARDGGRRRCILVTNNEVEQEKETRLLADGFLPGDPDWEAEGVFVQATKPRLEAAVSGTRPDGTPIPLTAKYVGRGPLADGFHENVQFFELRYLERDAVDLGEAFRAVAPLLWMKGGGVGPIPDRPQGAWFSDSGTPFAVLFAASHWRLFVEHLQARQDVKHAFIVTDSEATFIQIRQELPAWIEASMLYRDYLRSFEINVGDHS